MNHEYIKKNGEYMMILDWSEPVKEMNVKNYIILSLFSVILVTSAFYLLSN